jgi:hypothetical protein
MASALTAALLGVLFGLRHATDADHVVAVTAIVADERNFRRAARIGVVWGIGHSVTLLVVGGAIIIFRLVIPPRIGLGLEFGVALMLILLGVRNLRPAAKAAGAGSAGDARPFFVGVVHGLAGSAGVTLLVLATIRQPVWAVAYLALFGLGTVAGMAIVTAMLAAPARYAGVRIVRFQRGIRLAAGAVSLAFGLALASAIVVSDGLFSATPVWSPR